MLKAIILIAVFLGIGLLISQGVFEKETKILFVGDMMFDRTIRKIGYAKGSEYVFSCVKDLLPKYDMVVGNLEGPITSNPSVSLVTTPGDEANMTFTFPTAIAKDLASNNIKAVSLANNHILNFGKSGLEQTRENLKAAGVGWFGDPYDLQKKTYIINPTSSRKAGLRGTPVALVGFNQFLGVDSIDATVLEIKKLKTENGKLKIVIFAHWGDEYVAANKFQKEAAHAFIDAGADLVIGAHPHVIQESEDYKGKKIYYSLGNFIFDQWWEEKVRQGLGVELTIKGDTLETKTINFESSRDGRVCID